MDPEELFLAGRLLMKLGQRATPGSGGQRLPLSVRTVLSDAAAHPGSSIGELAARTGLLQSHVSTAVVRLRRAGLLVTNPDPEDGRRTLVRVRDAAAASAPTPAQLDALLVQALTARLGSAGAARVAEVTQALEVIVKNLKPPRAARKRRRD